jgi:hypothetical protein
MLLGMLEKEKNEEALFMACNELLSKERLSNGRNEETREE